MTKTWRDVLPVHPAADLFPMVSTDELTALGEDIKTNGLQVPIVIWSAKNDERNDFYLLDGRNRLDAMEMVGLQPVNLDWKGGGIHQLKQVEYRKVYGDNGGNAIIARTDPYAFVVSANIHRRQLTAEQKRDLIGRVLKADPAKSNRQIAATIKVTTDKTVAAVRKEMESTAEIPQLTATTGKDGKTRDRRRFNDGGAQTKRNAKRAALKASLDKMREVPETVAESATGKALAEFRFAVDHWLPRMTAADRAEACQYFMQKCEARS